MRRSAAITDSPSPLVWGGVPIPADLAVLPHPRKLRLCRPVPLWWRGLVVLLTVFWGSGCVAIIASGGWRGLLVVSPFIAILGFLWTRGSHWITTFRPRSNWVSSKLGGVGGPLPKSADSVSVTVVQYPTGVRSALTLRGDVVGEATTLFPDEDAAFEHLRPLANAIRREMGGSVLRPRVA